jgi:hypothetical protein
MLWSVSGGLSADVEPYRARMKTQSVVAPRIATIDRNEVRREGRPSLQGSRIASAAAGVAVAIALGACSPGASAVPLPSVALPSVDASAASAAASVATQAALAALDQVDAAITANQASTGLTADEASSLKQLTAGIRTALQSGDTTAARTAIDNLSTKVDGFAAKLNTDAGTQLKAAIAALKAALPAS